MLHVSVEVSDFIIGAYNYLANTTLNTYINNKCSNKLNQGGLGMKVRTIKKQIKALKGKFNIGVNYNGTSIVVGQPNIHKSGIGIAVGDTEFEYLPWKVIKGVVSLTEDAVY